MREEKLTLKRRCKQLTQVEGNNNGSEPKPNPEDIIVYEPVFVADSEEEEEAIGWLETDVKGEEGRVLDSDDLPPELRSTEPHSPNA
ncbi:hypothetical protein NIES2101_21755 [Calothrix sp. HK-06]|nr:hypothetical protein NIES2101_21755 [Calothrix sp. HK-06]